MEREGRVGGEGGKGRWRGREVEDWLKLLILTAITVKGSHTTQQSSELRVELR